MCDGHPLTPRQAVIRLSKQFLPHMSAGFEHPKVKVHIGDGFKVLDDYKNTFDVIITDSSDPEGPAESLFQKPYFQLMHDALREGGVITTQGCMSHLLSKVETWEECFVSPGQALNLPDPALCHLSGGCRVVVRLGFPPPCDEIPPCFFVLIISSKTRPLPPTFPPTKLLKQKPRQPTPNQTH
jgi:hypothetical protein